MHNNLFSLDRPLTKIAAAIFSLAGACQLAPGTARAEDGSTAASAPMLEEVIVTARKRTESLEDVPVSVQVVGGQTAAQHNLNSLNTLTQTTPAVHISSNGGLSNDLYIRGIGSGENPGFEQSVAIFEDGIYHGRSRLTEASFLDLNRVEILKGPQSTYFGNNAIAGALNIVSNTPGDSFDAAARLLYGQFGQYAAEGAIGGPVTDTFGVRVAASRSGQAGWITNVSTGAKAPDQDNEAARVTLVYKPTDDLTATLKVEGSVERTFNSAGDTPFQFGACPPPAPFPTKFLDNHVCPAVLAANLPTGLNNNLNTGLPGQFIHLSTNEDLLTLAYNRWDLTFTSVTGFLGYHYNEDNDVTNIPLSIFASGGGGAASLPEKYHQFSQEFRVASATGQTLEYMFGGYFQTDEVSFDYISYLHALDVLQGPFPGVAPYLPIGKQNLANQGEHVYSVFGSLRWNVTDKLRLNAGFRDSWVNKDFDGSLEFGSAAGPNLYGQFTPFPASLQNVNTFLSNFVQQPIGTTSGLHQLSHAPMPSGGIEYQVTPEALTYATYTRGFKAGGYNFFTPNVPLSQLEYGPEFVDDYELGIKSKWFDSLLINLNVFLSKYKDLQVNGANLVQATGTYINFVTNAAMSRSEGVELQAEWAATRDFRLSADVTYLESYYINYLGGTTNLQSFCNVQANYTASPAYCSRYPSPAVGGSQFFNFANFPTEFSPRFSGIVTARYSPLIGHGLRFIGELSPYFTSRYNPDPDGLFRPFGDYIRLDARLSLETDDGRWAIDVIGKNLTDRIIPLPLTGNNNGGGEAYAKEAPRNVAVQFRYHFL